MQKRSAIALMITLLFIVAITASLGISLGYVNQSNQKIEESKLLVKNSLCLTGIVRLSLLACIYILSSSAML